MYRKDKRMLIARNKIYSCYSLYTGNDHNHYYDENHLDL